jgi:sporulation protein YlmC with PRC-barrel domain/DNA-directed RNA polymerase subunit RPC12/RpoP
MISADEEMREKKLRGSGGFVIASINDEEQKKGNLGGPELFLAGIGRLPDDRFVRYHCNKCEKDFDGMPDIKFENPNEDLGEGVTLLEKGEYKCHTCGNIIAQYRKFDSNQDSKADAEEVAEEKQLEKVVEGRQDSSSRVSVSKSKDEFVSIQSLVGMPAYDHDALLLGNVQEVGLRRFDKGKMVISLKISKNGISEKPQEISWNDISKIGDIILLAEKNIPAVRDEKSSNACPNCGFENEGGAIFCTECGKKIA